MRCPVQVEQVVTLAEPGHLCLNDVKYGTYVMALPPDVEEGVVPAGHGGTLLPVIGVEITEVRRQRSIFAIVHVIVIRQDVTIALVSYRDLARFPVGHRPVAVACTSKGAIA